MRHDLFKEIAPPKGQDKSPINDHASWHTWSDSFRRLLDDSKAEFRRLAAPPLIRIRGLGEYDRTYCWRPSRWRDPRSRRQMQRFGYALIASAPRQRLMLFDGLISEEFDATSLHAMLALLRGAIADILANEKGVMYTPLGTVGPQAGEFPLHADLYIPTILFNVFDNVPKGNSGASTFLPVAELRTILDTIKTLPPSTRRKIHSVLSIETTTDRFETFYDLLHNEKHPWTRELERAMARRQMKIKMRAGQGYMLHDRTWLHGRSAPKDGVAINRVHRLVFNPAGGPPPAR